MKVLSKLLSIQNELKAPKGQFNSFGKYKYRSAEDILESVKPLCFTHKAVLTVSDELVLIGDRYYIKATAKLSDIESDSVIDNIAYAREEESKKGMDGSQITGTASSYARKYALNGLFAIDDTKDADTDEHTKATKEDVKEALATATQLKELATLFTPDRITKMLAYLKIKDIKDITREQASDFIKKEKSQ